MNYYEYPAFIQCEGKFPEWQNYAIGIILDFSESTKSYGAKNPCGAKHFHYFDHQGKGQVRRCQPGFLARNFSN